MNLKQCKNGHFYDADKYSECPHCNGAMSSLDATIALKISDLEDAYGREEDERKDAPEEAMREMIPEGMNQNPSLEEAIREAQTPVDELDKTVSFYRETLGAEPVVGWLTCIKGKHFGKSFSLHSGRNYIGRDRSNDVVLANDMSISRIRHAAVVYDPRGKCFIVQPGESRELFYVNDRILLSNALLQAYDILSVGNEDLLFIPMCGERFCWEETEGIRGKSGKMQEKTRASREETGKMPENSEEDPEDAKEKVS